MSLRHVMLTLLCREPATGYEITQEFDAVAGFFWKASHQQIYRELAQMADAGLVEFQAIAQDGKPDKKLYTVTPEGRQELQAWFRQPLPLPRASDPLMVKFFGGDLGGIAALREQLAATRADHQARLDSLQQVERVFYAEPVAEMPTWKACIYLSLQNGLARERAWLDWAAMSDTVLRDLEARTDPA
jgi:PadR family transcriptional regulator AphA